MFRKVTPNPARRAHVGALFASASTVRGFRLPGVKWSFFAIQDQVINPQEYAVLKAGIENAQKQGAKATGEDNAAQN